MLTRGAYLLCWLLAAVLLGGCNKGGPEGGASSSTDAAGDRFLSLMNSGKNYLLQGDATNAIAVYKEGQALFPTDLDARLNLATAYLTAGAAEDALREAEEALKMEPNSAAAHFIQGSAHLRLGDPEEAVKALENAKTIDPGDTATFFQLGLARTGLRQWEEAINAFQAGIATDPNRLHSSARYLLGQALIRAGREAEAQQELLQHAESVGGGGGSGGAAAFERSKHTLPRVPFKLDQPALTGIKVQFTDATREMFPGGAERFAGPLAVLDLNRDGWNSLFVMEQGSGFRLLLNSNGVFVPHSPFFPARAGAKYAKALAGDFENDRSEDVMVLGDLGSHLFQFKTNGAVADVSEASGISQLTALDGTILDLDFTGKLDLVAVTASNSVRALRQHGPLNFRDITNLPPSLAAMRDGASVMMGDWNRDEVMDLVIGREGLAPLLLEKQRGGALVPKDVTNWVSGKILTVADFDNDLRPDIALASDRGVTISYNDGRKLEIATGAGAGARQIEAIDYDNDGWLDLAVAGDKFALWRNAGNAGFKDQTTELGLANLAGGAIAHFRFVDLDKDCDSDLLISFVDGGLRLFRNQGGNANGQVKVQLIGNRSNASGIGCKVQIETGGLRLIRTVHQLPVEIGVGRHQMLDSFLVHWFNWPQGSAQLPFGCDEPLLALELTIQEGSCPYVYVWDGEKFQFVTDILGSAPLGLPVSSGRHIESDPEEHVRIGNEQTFRPKDGAYTVQITEELRETLYLDEAKLVVVDREPGTEVHSKDKLRPGKPFPAGGLLTVHNERPLLAALRSDGLDVTAVLKTVDGARMSPPKLRGPHLRGLAEPHSVTLDFGPLDSTRPLVMVMNGWLRFGGGMANIAASHDPSMPFPFPTLEAEVAPEVWQPVDVVVGAPSGKTKTIVVELDRKLPANTRALRLSQAFEIHWDRIALMEKKEDARSIIHTLQPNAADLHFRGFSELQPLPSDWPLTPDYARVHPNGYWTIIPGGWCTRYGDVMELISTRDEGLALINAGDELTLQFSGEAIPPKAAGMERDFFLYVDGWDKDSDFHVTTGTTVEPLPFHGMNDQLYGREPRPKFESDRLHEKYNTRWVEPRPLRRTAQR